MAKNRRTLAIAAFVAAHVSASGVEAADRPAIAVDLQNYADVPPALVKAAGNEVKAIYDAAGIRILWLTGTADAIDVQPVLRLSVLLLTAEMQSRLNLATDERPTVFGRACRSEARAWILWDRIRTYTADHHADAGLLLGRVIAHELGHLVLPAYSHSNRGIMQARMDPTRSVEQFTSEQVRTLHTILVGDSFAGATTR